MVLVSHELYIYISILQTKFSYGEGHEARRIGLETMPLDQYVEGGHGEREPGVERRPDAMHDLFEMAEERQHREHRLHQHTVLPRAALTQFQIAGIPLCGMESRITQDNHLVFTLANQPLKGIISDIGGGTRPPDNQPVLVQQKTQFPADNPAMIGEPFAADLLRAAPLAHGVDQLNAIGVDDPEHGRGGPEDLRPSLMGREETKEPGALGKPRK